MLDILIRCPESNKREEKKEDLNLLFIHTHRLINEFRPHQARETLLVMLDVQRVKTTERFQKQLEKVMEVLQTTLASLPDTADIDCKLLVPTESIEMADKEKQAEEKEEQL